MNSYLNSDIRISGFLDLKERLSEKGVNGFAGRKFLVTAGLGTLSEQV